METEPPPPVPVASPPPRSPRRTEAMPSSVKKEEEAAAAAKASPSAAGVRALMDVDLDLDNPDSWPFDPLALVAVSPPSSLGFPAPPSPLWLFEDRASDAHGPVADSQRFLVGHDNKTMEIQLAGEDVDTSPLYLMKQRMTQALRYLKESTHQQVLVQVWAPVKDGNRFVLTTSGQPFVLDPQSAGLLQYRTVSVMYMFSVDGDNDGDLGLPGRVYRQKMPEWTPNVQYYSSKEYPRLCHALNYNVQGTLALPVFEPSAQFCIGVVELIMTSQKINYAGEVDKVCKALEAVSLKSSEIIKSPPNVQICNEGRQAALAEILKILTMVCERHNLPLAQTWVPCKHRRILADGGGSKKNCSSFDGGCMGQVCMSTTDVAFHVIDAKMWGFREACVEHHLQKGQGVAGMSFASRRPCFSMDITRFCKTEYPLVHYARMFKLQSCFAICLQSTYTGNDDYVLEFFLPPDCNESVRQHLLKSMITIMTKCFQSLRPSTDVEPREEIAFQHPNMFAIEYQDVEPKLMYVQSCEYRVPTSAATISSEGLDDLFCGKNTTTEMPEKPVSAEVIRKDGKINSNGKTNGGSNGNASCNSTSVNKKNKLLEKRRGKAEKKISLEVLQQYFCGSLKDAAKCLGVCPTTMKRICRQHGISRWPSRKINKVNRSLTKLKQVIESVQGTDGAFSLTSITGPLPAGVGSTTWRANIDESKHIKVTKSSSSERHKQASTCVPPHIEDLPNAGRELPESHSKPQLEPSKTTHSSKSRSYSGQESTSGAPGSEGSCQGSPANDTHESNQIVSSKPENFSSGAFNLYSVPDDMLMQPPSAVGGMLAGSSGTSKDLRAPPPMENCHDEDAAPVATQPVQMPDTIIVTVKASYKGNIIRFRQPITAGVLLLKKEISKRLKMEVDMFDIKYMDDDSEWVTMSCTADLEECVEVSRQAGGHLIRLLVVDTTSNLGSSCESSRGH